MEPFFFFGAIDGIKTAYGMNREHIVAQLLLRSWPFPRGSALISTCFLKNVAGSNVIAIEPQPTVVDLLRKNLSQFVSRAQVLPVAPSDHDGSTQFHINSNNRGASRIVDAHGPSTPLDAGRARSAREARRHRDLAALTG